MKTYINGKTVNPWTVLEETYKSKGGIGKRLFIRRWVVGKDGKGKNERYPTKKYSHLIDNRHELEQFVRRLNAEIFRRDEELAAILDKTAFLNERMIERYREHLDVHLPNENKVDEELNSLKTHVINVFVGQFNLINPKDWIHYEDRWYKYLLEDENTPRSTSSKKRIIQYLNRFMRWLHKERRDEIPLVQFDGPGFRRFQDIERDRVAKGETRDRKAIPDEDWIKIKKTLPNDIRPWILLCYDYGLRRSEALGLVFEGTDCVYEKHIVVKKQLVKYNPKTGIKTFEKLKSQGRQSVNHNPVEYRQIPHWLGVDPNHTCDLIEDGLRNLMHPTTLTKRWRAYMETLKMTYDIHDIRHTWITRARGQYSAREVQLAAGHASILTTEGYSHDPGTPGGKRLRPSKKAA